MRDDGYWSFRIFDACGFTDRLCCERMGVGCSCEWCWALLKRDEAKKRMEHYAAVLERLECEKEVQEEEERRGGLPVWQHQRW